MTNNIPVKITTPQATETQAAAARSATQGTRKSMTCERLLDAAMELFAERGFGATTTKLIAQRAGVPHGLIHYHFGTKHNMLASLMAERSFLPEIEAHFAAARANGSTDPRSTLVECCMKFFDSHQRHQSLARIIQQESYLDQELRNTLLQFEDRLLKLMAEFLEVGSQQGAFRPLDAEMVAQALLFTLAKCMRLREIPEPQAFCERLVDALVC
jgi:AcrR family transcriptional regulator